MASRLTFLLKYYPNELVAGKKEENANEILGVKRMSMVKNLFINSSFL